MARLLDRLQSANAPGLPRGLYTWAQRVCEQIEAQFGLIAAQVVDIQALQAAQADLITNLGDQVAAIAAAQAAADAAQATATAAQSAATTAQSTATTANTNATAAQSTANTVQRDDAISSSWIEPGTVLSATDAGSNATIAIANHVRKYNDGTSVSFSSVPALTGKAYNTKYFIYYTDSSRSNTSPSFLATTNANTAIPNAATGRHFVGEVTTPASGGAPTDGGFPPPGAGGAIAKFDVS